MSKDLRNFLVKHVRFVEDPEFPAPAGTQLTDEGYKMCFGKVYLEADEETQRMLILHEMDHILRGDCLPERREGKRVDLLNIAQDAHINEHLDRELVLRTKGVLYQHVLEQLPPNHGLPTTYLPGTIPLYKALHKHCECGSKGCGGLEEALQKLVKGCVKDYQGKNPQQARNKHTEVILDARDVQELTAKGYSLTSIHKSRSGRIELKPQPVPLVKSILDRLRGMTGPHRTPTRTYLRPGRVPLLRGSHVLPRLTVFMAVDGSGSCGGHYVHLASIAKYLGKHFTIDLVGFNTEVWKARSAEALNLNGGGTAFQPVWAAANRAKADIVIIATDGDAGDITPLPKAPVLWLLTEANGGVNRTLREADKALVLPAPGEGA